VDSRGIPFFTLDPATGEMVAMYEDGTVTPLPSSGGVGHAAAGAPGAGGTAAAQENPVRPVSGGQGLSRADAPAGGGAATYGPGLRTLPPPLPDSYIPSPDYPDYGGASGGGGAAGGGIDVRSRLASARARIQGALGGGDSGYSGGGDAGGSGIPTPPRPDRLRGRYAKGLDPTQAAGLTLQPTAMLPRVFPNLTPADPLYGRLASLPVGQWASILGRGTPQSIANQTGRIYERAAGGALPSTNRLLKNLRQGGGIEDSFQGVKAGPNDYESFAQPGYQYGAEPMPMGEAAYTYGGLLDSALAQEPLLTAQKYGVESGGWGSYLVDKWASKAMKKPPGRGKPIYKSVGSKLFR
jgi:hypothetical protein